jgi:hypothetical protein
VESVLFSPIPQLPSPIFVPTCCFSPFCFASLVCVFFSYVSLFSQTSLFLLPPPPRPPCRAATEALANLSTMPEGIKLVSGAHHDGFSRAHVVAFLTLLPSVVFCFCELRVSLCVCTLHHCTSPVFEPVLII